MNETEKSERWNIVVCGLNGDRCNVFQGFKNKDIYLQLQISKKIFGVDADPVPEGITCEGRRGDPAVQGVPTVGSDPVPKIEGFSTVLNAMTSLAKTRAIRLR